MKYYVTFVKRVNDGTESREITAYNSSETARAAAYTKMGTAMSDTNCTVAFVTAVTENGNKIIDRINYRTEVE